MVINSRLKDTVFFIPLFDEKYLIYDPLRPIAFVGNEAMVDYIKNTLQIKKTNLNEADLETEKVLKEIGFISNQRRIFAKKDQTNEFKPTIGVILVTTACNLNCVYCYASPNESKTKIISLNSGKKLIDIVYENAKLKKVKFFSISFHGGGEPTIPKAQSILLELINYAKTKDIECKISLTSNGFWNHEETEKFLNSGITEISLSCDGIAEIQNKQRPSSDGGDSFEKVYSVIKAIERKGIPYGIRFSVMDDSIDYLIESIRFFCENTNCGVFQVEPVFNHGKAEKKDNYLRNNTKFVSSFMDAFEIADSYKRKMYYSGARPWIITDQFCLAPKNALILNHNNELTTCYEVFGKEHNLSDFFIYGEMEDTGELKINPKIKENLDNFIETRKTECLKKNCFCFFHCAGDCPPKAMYSKNEKNDKFSYRCRLNRELTKELLLYYIEKSGGVWHGKKV